MAIIARKAREGAMISEFPLFLFTLLGGIAAGLYAAAAVFPLSADKKRPWLVPTVAVVLLGIGGVALLFHLGRPERMFLAFANIQAGITQEAYASIAFGILIVVDLVLALVTKKSNRVVRVIGAVLGLVLVCVMAGAYTAYSNVAAWASWITFALFITGAYASGVAVATLLDNGFYTKKTEKLTAGGVYALFALAAVLEGVHYSAVGQSATLFVMGAIFGAAAAVCAFAGKKLNTTLVWIIAIVLVAGVAFARYGFYLA